MKQRKPETDLRDRIRDALLATGTWCTVNAQKGKYKSGLGPGSSDLIAIVHGRLVGIEVKMPGEKARANQLAWGDEIREHGAVYAVVTSVGEAIGLVRTVREWTQRPTKIERWVD